DDAFVLPRRLSSIRRLPPASMERLVALGEEGGGMLTLPELAEGPPGDERPGEALVAGTPDRGPTTRAPAGAAAVEGTPNWMVAYGSTEAWRFLNLTEDTHPMHVHLVHFQILARDRYDTSGFDVATGGTRTPVVFRGQGEIDANERGWKETVRVNPGEMV